MIIWTPSKPLSCGMTINSHNSNNNPVKYYYLPLWWEDWVPNKLNKLTLAFQLVSDGAGIQIQLWPPFSISACFSHFFRLFQWETWAYSEGSLDQFYGNIWGLASWARAADAYEISKLKAARSPLKRWIFFSEFIKMLIYLEPDFWSAEPNYLIWESQSLEMH